MRAADADPVARLETANLDHRVVHPRAVGAFQIGQDDFAAVELHLGVVAADAFVVEAKEVALFAADGDRGGQVLEHPALVDPVQHPKGHSRHRGTPRDVDGAAPARGLPAGPADNPPAGLIAQRRQARNAGPLSFPRPWGGFPHCQAPQTKCQFPADRPALGHLPEPGQLPPGQVAAADLDQSSCLFACGQAVEVGEGFLVADGLGRLAAERPRQSPQPRRLLDQPPRRSSAPRGR